MYFNYSSPWMIMILVILIMENLQTYFTNSGSILELLLSIPGLLIAITFHEFAHAWVADRLGDDTPRRQGRLTLNPIAHLDPYGVILLLFAGFGWGKPVQINPNNFNRKVSIKKGNALVSLAGPAMNFVLAIIFAIIYGLMLKFGKEVVMSKNGAVLLTIIEYVIVLNEGLGVFNLIPLPPLDGSKILVAMLPTNARIWYENHQSILYIVSLLIWITPLSTLIITPAIRIINSGLMNIIYAIA